MDQTTQATATDLRTALEGFQARLNAHPRIKTLLKGWDRLLLIDASDKPARYLVRFADTKLTEITEIAPAAASAAPDAAIIMRAPCGTLSAVFSGVENPATLFMNGALEVYASDKDHMKLDAVALVLWD